MKYLFLVFIILITPITSAKAGKTASGVLSRTYQSYIVPKYEKLNKGMEHLDKELRAFCNQPDKTGLVKVRDAYKSAALSWAAIEWLRIGPVMTANRVERIFYFPDRKSRGLRQVMTALEAKDKRILIEEASDKSVAVQGLGALDVILFGGQNNEIIEDGSYQCQFAKMISLNMRVISTRVSQDWRNDKGLIKNWGKPSTKNPFFRTDKEALNFMMGTIIHGLQGIRDARLSVFLRKIPVRDRPRSAALWRAGLSIPMIRENLIGLKAIFIKSGLADLPKGEDAYIRLQIVQEFERAIKTASNLNAPVSTLLKEKDTRGKLLYLKATLTNLIRDFNELYAPSVGLSAGFSFGDGD